MEPLEGEGVYICCGCGRRIPMFADQNQNQNQQQQSSQITQGNKGGTGGIKVTGSLPTTGSGSGRITFAQPKHQSARDWFKRKHDPKNNGKYDADDIALMNRAGVTITHTFEIKRKPDTLPNPNENRNKHKQPAS
jgi:hypothetical protein